MVFSLLDGVFVVPEGSEGMSDAVWVAVSRASHILDERLTSGMKAGKRQCDYRDVVRPIWGFASRASNSLNCQ